MKINFLFLFQSRFTTSRFLKSSYSWGSLATKNFSINESNKRHLPNRCFLNFDLHCGHFLNQIKNFVKCNNTELKSKYSDMQISQKVWPQCVVVAATIKCKHIGQIKSWLSCLISVKLRKLEE